MTITERNNKLKQLVTCIKCKLTVGGACSSCPNQYQVGTMNEIVENLEEISKILEPKPYEKFESAKDHIYKLAGDYKCWDNRLTEDEAVELCHILEQQSCSFDDVRDSLKKSNWIPVSEKMPDPQENGDKDYSDWLQVTIDIGRNGNSDTYVCEAYYCFSENKWYTKRFVVGIITAWMPLHEPYRAES